jgi:hypothetical protein
MGFQAVLPFEVPRQALGQRQQREDDRLGLHLIGNRPSLTPRPTQQGELGVRPARRIRISGVVHAMPPGPGLSAQGAGRARRQPGGVKTMYLARKPGPRGVAQGLRATENRKVI